MSYGANDPHGTPPATGWDYAITFPTPPPPQKHALLACLRDKGFHYSQHVTNKFIFVRLALPETVMMEKAELLGKELKLRQNYGGGYLPFSRDRAHVFENERRLHGGYFSPADRVLITLAVLRSREGWGADIDLGRLKKAGVIQQAFALHSDEREDLLHRAVFRQWWNPFRAPPVQLLKDYFGSRVTVYLAWLMFYARMLMGIACLSVPVYVTLNWSRSERIGDAVRLAFGLCICFWGAYWLEYWKRRNAVLNVKWGLSDFYEDQGNEIRPEFRGSDDTGFYSRGGFVHLADLQPGYRGDADNVRLRNVVEDGDMSGDTQQVVVIGGEGDADFTLEAPVTGLVFGDLPTFPYFSHSDLRNRMYMSAVVTAFFAICVGVCSFLILFYKRAIIGLFGGYIGGRGNVVPGIMTGLLISVSDPFWKKVSLKLATWENHRTNQSFENSLIWKRFAFQFVSSKSLYTSHICHRVRIEWLLSANLLFFALSRLHIFVLYRLYQTVHAERRMHPRQNFRHARLYA